MRGGLAKLSYGDQCNHQIAISLYKWPKNLFYSLRLRQEMMAVSSYQLVLLWWSFLFVWWFFTFWQQSMMLGLQNNFLQYCLKDSLSFKIATRINRPLWHHFLTILSFSCFVRCYVSLLFWVCNITSNACTTLLQNHALLAALFF